MATWPAKINYATGDVLTAAQMNDIGGELNDLYTGISNRNPVLNSNFSVWQRGTSFSIAASTSNTYTADRWTTSTGANQACTISRQATGDTTNLPNIQYALRYQRNSGQTGTTGLNLLTNFETINSIPYAGKQVTVSFYARAGINYSATASALPAYLYSGTGTDQNAFIVYTGITAVANTSTTLTTSWQRFTMTGTVGATATELALLFAFTPSGTAGANDYYEITGVQLDLGAVALPYRPNGATYQAELAACQRYYYRATTDTANGTFPIMGFANATTTLVTHMKLPVTMRVKPSSVEYPTISTIRSYDGVTSTAMTALALSANSSQDVAYLDWTVASGLTQYRPYIISANSSASAYVGVNAEL